MLLVFRFLFEADLKDMFYTLQNMNRATCQRAEHRLQAGRFAIPSDWFV